MICFGTVTFVNGSVGSVGSQVTKKEAPLEVAAVSIGIPVESLLAGQRECQNLKRLKYKKNCRIISILFNICSIYK